MKKILISILFILLAFNITAQKKVRKEIRKGNEAYKDQRYGAAEESYHKALEENASSKEASFNLANSYYKQQRWDDAIKEYQHYLTIENENPEKMSGAWSNIGNTYLKKKAAENSQLNMQMQQGGQQPQKQQADNLDQSMAAYKNALRLNPADEDTRYNLAVVQKMIQDRDKNKDQDKNQDKQDQKKDKEDKQQDQDKKNQDQQDQKKDKEEQQQQQENQMSQQNIQQILEAIEQDEKATQEKVQQNKASEQKQKNQQNRKQNKDW